MNEAPHTTWRVTRVSGILPPGFTKRFNGPSGVTRWLGVPVDRVDIEAVGTDWALRYRHLPVLDVLTAHPVTSKRDTITAEAFLLLPRGRRLRFCCFRLERVILGQIGTLS